MNFTKLGPRTITVTGLRSHKLFGKNYKDTRYVRLINALLRYFNFREDIVRVNIGLATGSDLLAGLAIIKLKKIIGRQIKLVCYIPGIGQTDSYSDYELEMYDFILGHADEVIKLTKKPCTPKVLKSRNCRMVDDCEEVLALWNYNKYKSGTYNTINYAEKQDKTIFIINPFNPDERGYYHMSVTDEDMKRRGVYYTTELVDYADEIRVD